MIWVSPRSNSAEPWARGITATSADSDRISVMPRPSMRNWSRRMRWRTSFFVSERNAAPISFSRPSNCGATCSRTSALTSSVLSSRSCLPAMDSASESGAAAAFSTAAYTSSWYAGNSGYSPVGLAAFSASACCAPHRLAMNGLAASRPSATIASVGAWAPPSIRLMTFSVASASTIMIATSPDSTTRPATTMSKTALSSCSTVGNATHWPFLFSSEVISATRTPPTGPENGRPAICVDADAALIATTSYRSLGSRLRTVTTTWISLRRPSTNDGRSGRSIRRQVRIASVEGRPSRRKNEPGMRPAAYIRSSTSTVSGKKSKCSLGCLLAEVADSSMVSSSR